MPKPRKGTSEVFFDTFSSFPVDEQAIALRIMTEIHRQALKLRTPGMSKERHDKICKMVAGEEPNGTDV